MVKNHNRRPILVLLLVGLALTQVGCTKEELAEADRSLWEVYLLEKAQLKKQWGFSTNGK